MKKNARLILTALAVYVVLLGLLLLAETGAPGATIHSMWDAVWFSLITMTTVGYGDLSPVTGPGRVLGLIFALCSIGILTALIGVGLRLIGGAFIPRLRLRLGRKHRWYAFSYESKDAAALARSLVREDPGCLLIFPEDRQGHIDGAGAVRMAFDLTELEKLRRSLPAQMLHQTQVGRRGAGDRRLLHGGPERGALPSGAADVQSPGGHEPPVLEGAPAEKGREDRGTHRLR